MNDDAVYLNTESSFSRASHAPTKALDRPQKNRKCPTTSAIDPNQMRSDHSGPASSVRPERNPIIPLTEKELIERDAKRNIGEELFAAISEVKAGHHGDSHNVEKNGEPVGPASAGV